MKKAAGYLLLRNYQIMIFGKRSVSMTRVRTMGKQYNISKHRFYELYHFCLQYREWKDMLAYKTDTLKSPSLSNMPIAKGGISDKTSELAIDREDISKKVKLLENTAKETDENLAPYIIKAVTNEGITYNYLSTRMDIPCSKNTWYKIRRKFYYNLNENMKG